MALKIYKNSEIQDFEKDNTGNILFGLQKSLFSELLQIYDAFSPNLALTYVKAIKIDSFGNYISEKILNTDVIIYDAATSQYIIDSTKNVILDSCIYYLEFGNGTDIFKTEPFSVFGQPISLKFDFSAGVTQQNITLEFTGNININWDDGSPIESFSSGIIKSKTYANPGIYYPVIFGDIDNMTEFSVGGAGVNEINNFESGLLNRFYVEGTKMNNTLNLSKSKISVLFTLIAWGGGISNIIFPSSGNSLISYFYIHSDIKSLNLSKIPISATFVVSNCLNLSSIIFGNSGNGQLNTFSAANTLISPYDFKDFPISDSVNIDMKDNNWTVTEVDNQLIYLNATEWINGILNIAGNNASRSSTSDIAYNALIANGWTITVN